MKFIQNDNIKEIMEKSGISKGDYMSYVIYNFVEGVKMYLGYEDWELSKDDAILFNHFQAIAVTIALGYGDYEVAE